MEINLIGLAGLAGSGKDTAANHLEKITGLERYALASPIKETVNEMFGWDERHSAGELKEVDDPVMGFSPRKAYQLFGTEFGRALRDDLWVALADKRCKELGGLIVTDVRFENEAKWIRDNGGLVIHIVRDDCLGLVGHESEKGVTVHQDDWVCENNGTFRELNKSLERILEERLDTCLKK